MLMEYIKNLTKATLLTWTTHVIIMFTCLHAINKSHIPFYSKIEKTLV